MPLQYGELAAEIVLLVWGTPANFNRFRVLASLLQRCRSTEVNQTLHYVWPSPGLVHCIYIFGSSCLKWQGKNGGLQAVPHRSPGAKPLMGFLGVFAPKSWHFCENMLFCHVVKNDTAVFAFIAYTCSI